MKCTNCGFKVPDTAKVCGNCGHRLKAAVPVPPQTPAPRQIPARGGALGWAWGFGGAAVGLLGIGILSLGFVFLRNNQSISMTRPAATSELSDIPTGETDQPPRMTETATVTALPAPMPKVGLYPDIGTVWEDWRKGNYRSLMDLSYEYFGVDEGLLEGREIFARPVTLRSAEAIVWDSGWCAIDETRLNANLSDIEFQFVLNGQEPAASLFGTRFSTLSNNHSCFYKFTVLQDWPVGEHQVITVQRFKQDIDDGVSNGIFPAGEKVFLYTITVTP